VVSSLGRLNPFAVSVSTSPEVTRQSRSTIAASCPELKGTDPPSPNPSNDSTLASDSGDFISKVATAKESVMQTVQSAIPTQISSIPDMLPIFVENLHAAGRFGYFKKNASVQIDNAKSFTERYLERGLSRLPAYLSTRSRSMLSTYTPLNIKAPSGTLYLSGAGPGDPELLTMRTIAALKNCHVVVTDALVSPLILAKLPSLVSSGTLILQRAGNEKIASLLNQGNIIVKLLSKDPSIYGNQDVLESFRDTRHKVVVIPGISSAFGTGLNLLKKHLSDSLLIISGSGNESLKSLQQFSTRTTTVVYGPMGNLCKVVDMMKSRYYPENLPVALIEKSSWGEENGERVIRSTLGKVLQMAIDEKVESPAIFCAGWALRDD
jgi:uroporphyrin-III C-methyltransferase